MYEYPEALTSADADAAGRRTNWRSRADADAQNVKRRRHRREGVDIAVSGRRGQYGGSGEEVEREERDDESRVPHADRSKQVYRQMS